MTAVKHEDPDHSYLVNISIPCSNERGRNMKQILCLLFLLCSLLRWRCPTDGWIFRGGRPCGGVLWVSVVLCL